MAGPTTGQGRKAKGANFEREVIKHLQAAGIDCSRNGLTGQTLDQGDILGVPDWTIQCKAYSNVTTGIAQGVDGSLIQQATNNTEWTVAIVKRPRKSVADAYCTMPLKLFTKLLLKHLGLKAAINRLAVKNIELEQIVSDHTARKENSHE